jgi:hypothetical protein
MVPNLERCRTRFDLFGNFHIFFEIYRKKLKRPFFSPVFFFFWSFSNKIFRLKKMCSMNSSVASSLRSKGLQIKFGSANKNYGKSRSLLPHCYECYGMALPPPSPSPFPPLCLPSSLLLICYKNYGKSRSLLPHCYEYCGTVLPLPLPSLPSLSSSFPGHCYEC